MSNHITMHPDCQAGSILIDRAPDGRERDWAAKKRRNEYLANIYAGIDKKKECRLRECGTVLVFEEWENGDRRLHSMNSCRVRLCPLCAWRRSLKTFANSMQCAKWVISNTPEVKWLMLTLTIKNCEGEKLATTLSALMEAWNRFIHYDVFSRSVLGWYRGLEITYNIDADTYHPHFHVLLAVDPQYFSGNKYIKADTWREKWMTAARLDYVPQVNVQRLRTRNGQEDIAHAVAETAKYSVKDTDYFIPYDYDKNVEVVQTLDTALAGRRLVAYGGTLKEAHRLLKLEDEESGDLIHVGEEVPEHSEPGKLRMYFWHTGASVYRSNE